MSERRAKLERKSTETDIQATLNIDGKGTTKVKTPIGLLSHMLDLFAFHGVFDLTLEVKGDTHIDIHHTNEDIGIVLGKLFKTALKDNKGIRRFGSAFAPMESTLGHCVVDLSGRGYLHFSIEGFQPVAEEMEQKKGGNAAGHFSYTTQHLEHFLESFAHQLGANLVVTVKNPSQFADIHTVMETVFKSLGLALDQATRIDERRKGRIPSTKGIID